MAPSPQRCGCPVALVPLQGPFSAVVDKHVSDPWLKALLDLECFVLSGMTSKDTLTAGAWRDLLWGGSSAAAGMGVHSGG